MIGKAAHSQALWHDADAILRRWPNLIVASGAEKQLESHRANHSAFFCLGIHAGASSLLNAGNRDIFQKKQGGYRARTGNYHEGLRT
jgi:hypothetical protein